MTKTKTDKTPTEEVNQPKVSNKPTTAFYGLSKGPNGQLQLQRAEIDSDGKLANLVTEFTDSSGHLVVEEFKTVAGRLIMDITKVGQ